MCTYQELHTGKVPFSIVTPQQVDYATRCGDDNVWTIAKFDSLGNDVHSADHHCGSEIERSSEYGKLLRYLESQLAMNKVSDIIHGKIDLDSPSRCKDQGKDTIGVYGESLYNGQSKRDSLS